jgi:hypothetical protein
VAGLLLASQSLIAQINKVDEVKKMLETSNKDTVAWTYSGV